MDFAARLEQAVDYAVAFLTLKAPNIYFQSTNNLRQSIRKAQNPETMRWEILIGGELAPYAVYTNEEWISPKWKGKPNPNQGWVQAAFEEMANVLSAVMSGTITQENIQTFTNDLNERTAIFMAAPTEGI